MSGAGTGRRMLFRGSAACVLLAVGWAVPVSSQEYVREERPAPTSVERLDGPIVVAFPDAAPSREPVLSRAKQALASFPAFVSDTQLDLNGRTYYFLRDVDADLATDPRVPGKSEAWAGGGSIAVESGRLWGHVSVGGEFFASLPIHAPSSRPGTGLLEPTQDPILVAGQAYLRLKYGKQVVTLHRQRYDLPYINSQDSRMIPNTFEGYSIDGRWRYGRFIAGYIRRIKRRASNDFVSMSRALGIRGSERGLAMLGLRYEVGDGFWIGAIASVVPDVLSTVYSEIDKTWNFGELALRVGAQFTDQRSMGANLLAGGNFDTQSGGMRIAASFRHAVLTTAFGVTSDGARIRSPFGGNPSFTSLMLRDYTLANEKALRVGLSYDGGRIGLTGLSGFVNYARGFNPKDARTGTSIPESDEADLTLDIRPTHRFLRGAWFRLRAAALNPASDRRRVVQVRLVLNWTFALL